MNRKPADENEFIDLTYINILSDPNGMFYRGVHALFNSYKIKQGFCQRCVFYFTMFSEI